MITVLEEGGGDSEIKLSVIMQMISLPLPLILGCHGDLLVLGGCQLTVWLSFFCMMSVR